MHVYWHTKTKSGNTTTSSIVDVIKYVTEIGWSGADTEASRELTLSILNAPYNPSEQAPNFVLGDVITLYGDAGTRLFLGKITSHGAIGENGTVDYTVKDLMHNMLKSNITHKYKNRSAEAITKDVCKRVGVKPGALSKTGIKQDKLYAGDTPAYNIIMKAYKRASQKNGIQYFPYMNGTEFCVKQKGQLVGRGYNSRTKMVEESFLLDAGTSIISSERTEDIDNMVNRVDIYKKGKKIGSVSKKEWIKVFGVYQSILSVDKGNGRAEAKALLKGKNRSMSLEAIGDERCISGAGIKIRDKASGLVGTFWIKSDTHTWQNGNHQMSLTLTLKNVTENTDVSSESSSSSGSFSTGSATTKAENVVAIAKTFAGKVRYVFGAESPQNGRSDCSGYTQYCYKHGAGVQIGRTADVQYTKGKAVSKKNLRKGDLVAFHDTYKTNTPHCASHVGIMTDSTHFINCHSSGVNICSLKDTYWANHYLGGRRIV